ncbi:MULTISPECIES: SIS domain-containing protein [unclassified Methanothermobacter]|uniref:SIS domain-containing protein n=1 Tax=unclassified Methanothermobacter TaxID=2631116 RepID=UPI0011C82528|nr:MULTISPECIES: SIS domain-containing protein [unclassified Methanothermobacter]QEF94965.1 SIS domain-containing protein [Methanothermobacter sp. KEPCO-1]QHN07362.1 SIS domain-containing protein [Methanothermobacter sp. THM-2]
MKYRMYTELMEQPGSLKRTLKAEGDRMSQISNEIADCRRIYLVGCGSSLSTCYSARDAVAMNYELNIDVMTGYEFYYHRKIEERDSVVIFTSQSGETADTLAALRRATELGLKTVTITNEPESTMASESQSTIITRCGREEAILGTKTYMTQLLALYRILFDMHTDELSERILSELDELPDEIGRLLSDTEDDCRGLAEEHAGEDIFYCMGSGPNYGLAYKLAMTMLMEGALKHACPLYSGEFRHGLIERVEKGVPVIFLESGFPGDELTERALRFCESLGALNIVFRMSDYSDLSPLLSPFVLAVPLEWFVYYLAHFNGEDPGSTRHIGKVRY